MKKADIYEITLKTLGLYLFATAVIGGIESVLSSFAFVGQAKENSDSSMNWTVYLVIAVAQLALLVFFSAFVFFKANFIVRKICPTTDFEENAKLFAEPKIIYEIALIVTALLLIIETLPQFGYELKSYYQAEHDRFFKANASLKYLWISTAKLLVGIFLLLLARQLSRYFGQKRKQVDERNET
jgi:hypothetical protein